MEDRVTWINIRTEKLKLFENVMILVVEWRLVKWYYCQRWLGWLGTTPAPATLLQDLSMSVVTKLILVTRAQAGLEESSTRDMVRCLARGHLQRDIHTMIIGKTYNQSLQARAHYPSNALACKLYNATIHYFILLVVKLIILKPSCQVSKRPQKIWGPEQFCWTLIMLG